MGGAAGCRALAGVDLDDDQRPTTGPRFLHRGKPGENPPPKLRPAEWQVTELDWGTRSFTWVTRSPAVRVAGGHRVEEIGGGSRVTLTIQFSGLLGPLLARLYRNLNQQYLATEAKGLRERSEG
jgi:hypothetical protein